MCNTAVLSKMRKASCFRHQPRTAPYTQKHQQQQQQQQRRAKRDRESGPDEPIRRPVKRVSFSPSECVLGRAQDYDRTSFEVQRPMLRRASTSRSRPAPVVISNDDDDHDGEHEEHADFSGTWRRSHGFNWASLLEFSGVDKASIPAQAARMQSSSVVHLIDHDATSFRLVVHSDNGSTQEQHFFIGGQPRPNPTPSTGGVRAPTVATTTLSNMRWTKKGQALVLTSMDAATGDEMTVSRHLASKGTVIVQHYTARRAKTGETAEAITIFRKMVRGEGKGGDGDVPQ
ncbi:unnamed protein product [Scytosiphon promiscuus]